MNDMVNHFHALNKIDRIQTELFCLDWLWCVISVNQKKPLLPPVDSSGHSFAVSKQFKLGVM
jgi:hypothetical protein